MNQNQLNDILLAIDYALPAKSVELQKALINLLKEMQQKQSEKNTPTESTATPATAEKMN